MKQPFTNVTAPMNFARRMRIQHAVFALAWLCVFTANAQAPQTPHEAYLDGDYDAAIALSRDLLATDATDQDAARILGQALTAVGEYHEAINVYANAALVTPRYDLEIAAALLEYRHRDPEGAREQLQRIYERFVNNGDAQSVEELIAVGDAARLLSAKDSVFAPKALDIYERAIEKDPRNPAGHIAIGNLLLDRYNNSEASTAFYDALEIQPLNAAAMLGIARSQHFDRSTKTMDAVNKALEVQPNLVPARALLAQLYIELEDYATAEQEIEKALRVNPNDPQALTVAAAVHYLQDEDAEFERVTRKVRATAPGYSAMYETLAKIAAQNRRYSDAADFALYAVNLYKHAWRGFALLGINRLRLGDVERGRYSLLAAFGGDPYDLWTKNTLDLLDKLDTYVSVRSERFELVAHSSEIKIIAPLALPIAELAYDVYAAKYQHVVRTPIRIEIYKHHEDFSVRTIGLVGVDILGVSFGPVVALDSPASTEFNDFNWASVLWHELAHTFHLDMSRQRVPRWFSEGLAVYEERRGRAGWGNDVSPDFLAAFKQRRLYPISELNLSFLRPQYPEQVGHAYYQASLLMEMIDQDHGVAAIVDMLRGFRTGRAANALLQEVTGMDNAEIDIAFNRYIESKFATALTAVAAESDDETDQPPAYIRLLGEGAAALANDDLAIAEAKLLEAQKLFTRHAGPDSSYALLAEVYRRQGDPEAAAQQLAANVAIDADDLASHRRLAKLLVDLGKDGEAMDIYRRALYIQPFAIDLHDGLANLATRSGDVAAAVDARQAIIYLDPPDLAEAHYELASALQMAGRRGDAKREVLAALEFAPLYEDALELLLQLQPETGTPADPDAVDQARRDQPNESG